MISRRIAHSVRISGRKIAWTIFMEVIADEDWTEARRRAAIIDLTLPDRTKTRRLSTKEAARELGINLSTLYRWRKRYEIDRRVSALLPRREGRQIGASLIDRKVEDVIDDNIRSFYLTRERPPLRELLLRIHADCAAARLPKPIWRTLRRRLDRLNARYVVSSREGAAAAAAVFDPVVGEYLADAPLDVVQIDHTVVDIIVVDEITRQAIDRPILTLAIDVCTRMVTGFYLALDHPSTLRAGVCFAQAVLEKDAWLRERNIDIPWPVSGLPKAVHVDNAGEFHSAAFTRALQEFGVEIIYRPIATPRFGGHIERLIGTQMGAVHMLRGTTFSNVSARGDYPSEARAVMTLRELERWIAIQILGKYHQQVHAALKRPPIAVWLERSKTTGQHMPKARMDFIAGLLPFKWRNARRDGIHLFDIRYWSDALIDLLGRHEAKMRVRYDPRDLSRIYVERPDGQVIEAPYKNLAWEPVSLWEHQRARKRLADQGRHEINEEILFAAIREQRRIEDEAFRKSRTARRAEALRPRRSAGAATPAADVDIGIIDTGDPNLKTFDMEILHDGRLSRKR
jgi:putative transposase